MKINIELISITKTVIWITIKKFREYVKAKVARAMS